MFGSVGPGYICSSDWAWHLLDIFVSTSAVLDVASTVAGLEASLTGGSNSGFRLLRIMKIARLARAIRVVKAGRRKGAMRATTQKPQKTPTDVKPAA